MAQLSGNSYDDYVAGLKSNTGQTQTPQQATAMSMREKLGGPAQPRQAIPVAPATPGPRGYGFAKGCAKVPGGMPRPQNFARGTENVQPDGVQEALVHARGRRLVSPKPPLRAHFAEGTASVQPGEPGYYQNVLDRGYAAGNRAQGLTPQGEPLPEIAPRPTSTQSVLPGENYGNFLERLMQSGRGSGTKAFTQPAGIPRGWAPGPSPAIAQQMMEEGLTGPMRDAPKVDPQLAMTRSMRPGAGPGTFNAADVAALEKPYEQLSSMRGPPAPDPIAAQMTKGFAGMPLPEAPSALSIAKGVGGALGKGAILGGADYLGRQGIDTLVPLAPAQAEHLAHPYAHLAQSILDYMSSGAKDHSQEPTVGAMGPNPSATGERMVDFSANTPAGQQLRRSLAAMESSGHWDSPENQARYTQAVLSGQPYHGDHDTEHPMTRDEFIKANQHLSLGAIERLNAMIPKPMSAKDQVIRSMMPELGKAYAADSAAAQKAGTPKERLTEQGRSLDNIIKRITSLVGNNPQGTLLQQPVE